MTSDNTLPAYTHRSIICLLIIAVVGGIIGEIFWDWTVSTALVLGTLFHVLFFLFLRAKYNQWTKAGKEAVYIGRRIAGYAASRFLMEVILAVLVVVFTPLNIIAFLVGLLSLVFATILERIIGFIKD
jgi:hypothetical protein